MHWADSLALQIVERTEKEGRKLATIRSGQTPSGGKHIGNLNDPLRAHMVYKAVLELKKVDARFVNTSDDRDPLKDVPKRISDLDGHWHDSTAFPQLQNYLGVALVKVPDPFGCCSNYAFHFAKLWEAGLKQLQVNPLSFSADELYKQGKFDKYIEMVFQKKEAAGKIIARYQSTKGADYIPFDAICPSCNRLSNIEGFDLKTKMVHFKCGGKAIKKKRSEGCGFEGSVPFRDGKLQWRFEWPANWALFDTTFEPFGKDHFEGSWKSGVEIAREIFEISPPIPFVYEFFLVNGQKMSASIGNVLIIQDLIKFLEPNIFKYFYTKRPEKQRDLDLTKAFQLVDEFDEIERVYFEVEKEENALKEENARRMYELSMEKIPEKYVRKIPYSFAAALAQVMPIEKAISRLQELKHISNATGEVLNAKIRLSLAKHWAENYAGEEHRTRIISFEEASEAYGKLAETQKQALEDFAASLALPIEEQQIKVKEICEKNGLKVNEFFEPAYLLLIGKKKGPKLLPFINALDKELISKRFTGVG